jgi:hypothetical protein
MGDEREAAQILATLATAISANEKQNAFHRADVEQIVRDLVVGEYTQRERYNAAQRVGVSLNHLAKLQHRVLKSSRELRLREPDTHSLADGHILHVFFDSKQRALLACHEIKPAVNMVGSIFSYWRRRSEVPASQPSLDFRLSNKCREIFGGRSSYRLYLAVDVIRILSVAVGSGRASYLVNVEDVMAIARKYVGSKQ